MQLLKEGLLADSQSTVEKLLLSSIFYFAVDEDWRKTGNSVDQQCRV
jgi:hypothetical protein